MKVAVSIPDALFKQADELAEQLDVSRSELYARALESFVGHLSAARVRERLNEVYGESGDRDLDLEEMVLSDLPEERW